MQSSSIVCLALLIHFISLCTAFYSLPPLSSARKKHAVNERSNDDFNTHIRPMHTGDTQQQKVQSLLRLSLVSTSLLFSYNNKKAFASVSSDIETAMMESSIPLPCLTSIKIEDTYSHVVKKSSLDKRQFRSLTLSNQLRVVIISDPNSSRAAAAMDVHVGSTMDPISLPGLAHFCEHMSFLGTEKFPEESAFSNYLATHGGSTNAYTDQEDTVYYFDINSEFLPDALDRFSQFFIAPTFSEDGTARELNAIESEHSKNLNNDGFRLFQLEKRNANPDHPFNKFSTGNKWTLDILPKKESMNTRDELLKFHSSYYSANQMTLSICGTQSLDQLEKYVKLYFTDIKDKNIKNPVSAWWGKILPYADPRTSTVLKGTRAEGEEQQQLHGGNILEIVPVQELRRLTLQWPIIISSQEVLDKLLLLKPEDVVSHLIGHEGKGSIRSLLVANGWANEISAAISTELSDLYQFEVSVDLTENGFQKRTEIIDLIYYYIDNLLKDDKIDSYVYEEIEQLSKVAFDYSEKQDPMDLTSGIVKDMQLYRNPAKYFSGPRMYTYYPTKSEKAVQWFLNFLKRDNSYIQIISKDFEGQTNLVDDIYGTKYNNVTVTAAKTKSNLNTNIGINKLALPRPNDLIPTNFDLVSKAYPMKGGNSEDLLEQPPKLLSTATMPTIAGKWDVWHKLDYSFQQPKIYAIFALSVPKTEYDANFVVYSKLFALVLLDSLNEYLYEARLAGLSFNLEFTSKGLQFTFTGFNDKMDAFVKNILNKVINLEVIDTSLGADNNNEKVSLKTIERYRDLLLREYKGWKTQQPYSHASYYASMVTETLTYNVEEYIKILQKLDTKDVQKQLVNGKFIFDKVKNTYGKCLIMGNVDENRAIQLVTVVHNAFTGKEDKILEEQDRSLREVREVPLAKVGEDGYLLDNAEPNENDQNSCSIFYYQLPNRDIREQMILEIFSSIIEQPFYDDLRTKQQLGYIVYSGLRQKEGISSLCFVVQSSLIGSSQISNRIKTFIENFLDNFENNVSNEEFNSYKDGLIETKSEKDQRLTAQAARFWHEIINENKDKAVPALFNRKDIECGLLRSITKEETLAFIKKFVTSDDKRLLVSQVRAKGQKEGIKVTGMSLSALNAGNIKDLKVL